MARPETIAFALADVWLMVITGELRIGIGNMHCVEKLAEIGMKFLQLFSTYLSHPSHS